MINGVFACVPDQLGDREEEQLDFTRIPRHFGFYAGIVAAGAAGAITAIFAPPLALSVGVNFFFVVYLAVVLAAVPEKSPQFLRKHAAEEDAPAVILLLVMVGAVVVSAITLFLALAGDHESLVPLALGIASVVLGWFAVHTMWAIHYAYEYYDVADATSEGGKKGIVGGLGFPGEDEPDGTAFLYFSYVVGATAQTADTNVTSNTMRRLVLLHGVFSFFFNTVLVAAAVNIAVSLAG